MFVGSPDFLDEKELVTRKKSFSALFACFALALFCAAKTKILASKPSWILTILLFRLDEYDMSDQAKDITVRASLLIRKEKHEKRIRF